MISHQFIISREEINGTFNGKVNLSGSECKGGTFNSEADAYAGSEYFSTVISGGTFKSDVRNFALISGGDFQGNVANAVTTDKTTNTNTAGSITGGTFEGAVTNNQLDGKSATIDGGQFSGTINNTGDAASITSKTQLKVTRNLSGVKTSGTDWASYGTAYSETLTGGQGISASLDSLSVNGAALSSGQYTFDSASGALSIPAENVTGPISLTASSSGSLSSDKVSRIAGDGRYDTMLDIVNKENYPAGGTVYVASGANFPDALAVSGLCGTTSSPIVLTEPNTLNDQTKAALTKLAPSRIVLIGGEASVSENVKSAIAAAFPNADVSQRISGDGRIETADAIYKAGTGWSDQAIVADSSNFPDSLSIAAYAYAATCPIFLADKTTGLSADAQAALKASFKSVVIDGGTTSVTQVTEDQIKATGLDYVRLAGDGRYQSASVIASWTAGAAPDKVQPILKMTYTEPCVASGENNQFADALTGACLAGKNSSVMLLASATQLDTISGNLAANQGAVKDVDILGGTSAVPEAVSNAVVMAIG